MSKEKSMDIKMICDSCDKEQKSEKIDDTWEKYPNVPCECGGKFKPVLK